MNKYTVYIYIYIYIYGQEKIEDTKWVNWSRSKTNNGMAKRKRTNILVTYRRMFNTSRATNGEGTTFRALNLAQFLLGSLTHYMSSHFLFPNLCLCVVFCQPICLSFFFWPFHCLSCYGYIVLHYKCTCWVCGTTQQVY
jgi:hypothetical protein